MRRSQPSAVLPLLFLLAGPAFADQIDPELLAGMQARAIGPAGMSGRVAAIDAVAADPNIIYVGAATGGLWRSTDGGVTWKPLFDDQPVGAVGAVSVFQHNPDIIWVGTGEGNPRNSASVGNGVYKSIDGGDSWSHLGLEETERIHRIVLHPSDPDVAYAAALGRSWGENPERGIFKTEDGGKTWRNVLYVDEKTGAADLIMDPANPNKLFAAMWEHRRWPWFFRSGGPGSGLHVTWDGGESWKRLGTGNGLPQGELGRIGLGISRSDPQIVYALVEAEKSVLLRSEDGGRSFTVVNQEADVAPRPFYFADLRVDPERPGRVYSLWSMVSVSDDGGRSLRILVPFQTVHPDHHAMWIHPEDGSHLILGNDGGVAISRDRGQTWRFVRNLPLAQYYHIRVDEETPYNVYGGMQDNGSWRGPSAVWENGGIRNHHWEEVGFGDGFDTVPDPRDSLTGYSMSQEGYLSRWNLRTGERKDIRPAPPEDVALRFNWNAGIAIDPFDPDTIYYGSQFVHRSSDRGDTWEVISPDLTSNNPEWQRQKESGGLTPDVTGAENFTSILTIAPSPVERGVIWVGTDDGRLHLTRDGGESWTSLEQRLKKVPANTWIPHIEPSPFDAGTAFVVLDNHRRSDWTPYVFRTTDFGTNWTSLASDKIWGYALAIAQDPVDRELLFLGTEFGLYLSVDGGQDWMKWTHGLPTVSVMDLVVHPREHDLILGTHGRAAYILDDIRPLRTLTASTLAQPLHLFEIPDAQQHRIKQTGASRFPGHGEFRGENRAYGALITYSLNLPDLPRPDAEEPRQASSEETETATGDEEGEPESPHIDAKGKKPQVEIRVFDSQDRKIRTFKAPAKLGVNRAVWDLKSDEFKRPQKEDPYSFFRAKGPEVLPGIYQVVVSYGDGEARASVRVLPDPRFQIATEARQSNWEALQQTGHLQEAVAEGVERIRQTRADLDLIEHRLERLEADGSRQGENAPAPASYADLRASIRSLRAEILDLEKRLWVPPDTKGIVPETDVLSQIDYLWRSLGSSWDAPTSAQQAYLKHTGELLQTVLADLERAFADSLPDLRRQVGEVGIELLTEPEPLRLGAE